MPSDQDLTVAQLVVDSDLGQDLVASEAGARRVIRAVHISEFDDLMLWMVGDSPLMACGPALVAPGDAGVRYLERLAEKGVRVLIVDVGQYMEWRRLNTSLTDVASTALREFVFDPSMDPLRLLALHTTQDCTWPCGSEHCAVEGRTRFIAEEGPPCLRS